MRVHKEMSAIIARLSPRFFTRVGATATAVVALLLLSAFPIAVITHFDVHYRWQQRIDATHLADPAIATSLQKMLYCASLKTAASRL